jgi:hypothetical protein
MFSMMYSNKSLPYKMELATIFSSGQDCCRPNNTNGSGGEIQEMEAAINH